MLFAQHYREKQWFRVHVSRYIEVVMFSGRKISVSLKLVWSVEQFPGQPGLHDETLS